MTPTLEIQGLPLSVTVCKEHIDQSAGFWSSESTINDEWEKKEPLMFDGSGIQSNSLDAATRTFFSAVRRNGNVRSLKLRNISLGLESQEVFESILRLKENLQSLELYHVTTNSDPSGFCLVNSYMEDLTLSKCQINQEIASVLGERIQSGQLKKLKLVNMDLGTEALELIDGITKGSLCHLELRDIQAEQKIMSRLIQGLSLNSSIQTLFLDHCGIQAFSADDLCALVKSNKSLRTLGLSLNDLDGHSVGILTENGLKYNRVLRKLILDFNPIGDVGAKHLTNLLISNPTISCLSLVECDIWSPGCATFARGLANMQGLKRLSVDSEWENHIDILLESMKTNLSLVQLWTDHSAMLMRGDLQWKQLGFYMRLNHAKRRILSEPGVPTSIWPSLLAESNQDAAMLYYFLTHKPELVPAT
jgi:Ran GTPase-activating protein (RanGAP) involved in mRNA processing and transport